MDQPPVVNPSPKARFCQSGTRVSGHRTIVSSEQFEKSADAALLQYQSEVCLSIRDGNTAMAAGLKIEGAVEFLQTFRLLAESIRILPPPQSTNLDPKH
jgi:hypothetical protein